MNITHLKYFYAVATHHSVSQAAQQLYISQPSLSNAIKELEKEFAVTLFYRRHNGMFLTPEGTKLYNSVKDLLSRYDGVEQMLRQMGKNTQQLRLGIPPMISSFIFADLYKGFVLKHPEVDLTITEKGRYELLDKLNDGLLDIVLLPHSKPFDSSLSVERIGSLEIVCCISRTDPLAAKPSVSAEQLNRHPLTLFSDTFFQTRIIRDWFASAGIEPTVSLQTEQLSTAQSMIENGLTVGFMFKNLAEKKPSLAPVPLDPPIFVDVSVLRKKDSYVFDAMQKLERYLLKSNLFRRMESGA